MRLLPLAFAVVLVGATTVSAALISGTIQSVDADKLNIVVETTTGRTQTFSVPATARITLNRAESSLGEFAEGQRISITTDASGTVTRVTVRDETSTTSPRPAATEEADAIATEPAYWPQFRGPQRDNRSTETGLLDTWPEGGPPRIWTAKGLGEGYSTVSVVGDLILTMGSQGDNEYVFALDGKNQERLWQTRIARGGGDGPRSTPTIDGDRVYALGANGDLVCLNLMDGGRIWGDNILERFGGGNITWKICESVLIDDGKVICTPGGRSATIAALDKMTGRVEWTAQAPGNPSAAYASPIAIEVDGRKQYVNFTHTAIIGVSATGEFLWSNSASANGTANCSSPLFFKDHVFSSSGYDTGAALVDLRGGEARQVYHTRQMENHHGGMVIVGEHLYGTNDSVMKCLDVMTGDVMWQNRSVGKGSVVYADGHIILRSENGPVALMEANPREYVEKGRFDQPERSNNSAWPHPVVADGKLYLRDQQKLLVYDLRE